MENLESVKSLTKSNFKIGLIGNIPGFQDKDIYRYFTDLYSLSVI